MVVIVKAIKDGKEINTIQVKVKVKELKNTIKSYLSKFKNIDVPKYYDSEDEVMQAIRVAFSFLRCCGGFEEVKQSANYII